MILNHGCLPFLLPGRFYLRVEKEEKLIGVSKGNWNIRNEIETTYKVLWPIRLVCKEWGRSFLSGQLTFLHLAAE